jgi:hypothetical protein
MLTQALSQSWDITEARHVSGRSLSSLRFKAARTWGEGDESAHGSYATVECTAHGGVPGQNKILPQYAESMSTSRTISAESLCRMDVEESGCWWT